MQSVTNPATLSKPDAAIQVSGFTKKYGKTTAVDRLDLMIPRGTVFGLLGPNGAGKTTLIRAIMGLIAPDQGTVTVLGFNATERLQGLKQKIGYVPEIHHIYRWMRIDEVIRFVRPFYPSWDVALCDVLVTTLELPTKKRVRELSKGMLAKLGLLIALSHKPDMLILDEPTSGLDPLIREEFLESILRADDAESRTVLFSSHHVDDVERIADVIGMMIGGSLVLNGPADEIRQNVHRIEAVLKDGCLPSSVPVGTAWQRVNRREWLITVNPMTDGCLDYVLQDPAVVSAEVVPLSLEQIFKDLSRGARNGQQELQTC